jgi:hypothetical protein
MTELSLPGTTPSTCEIPVDPVCDQCGKPLPGQLPHGGAYRCLACSCEVDLLRVTKKRGPIGLQRHFRF